MGEQPLSEEERGEEGREEGEGRDGGRKQAGNL